MRFYIITLKIVPYVCKKFVYFFSVRPFQTKVIGAEAPHKEGSVVSLMCRTWGARPAAVITWFNGSRPFSEQPAGQVALQVRSWKLFFEIHVILDFLLLHNPV